ncbi:MAG: DNA primase [Clostridiaceae bacterium]|nr:DNA primase [Clostridiaceae bacterium]
MNGRISQQTIEAVKNASDIVDVVEQYVVLSKRSGNNRFGLCPFHREKTPSFSVSVTKQIFYCFGCHKGGDVINFIMNIERLDYVEAIRFLAQRAGIAIVTDSHPHARARREEQDMLTRINTDAARFFYAGLNDSSAGRAARAYLKDRQIGTNIQRKFGVGFARDSFDALHHHLTRLEYPLRLQMDAGLVRESRDGRPVDMFRNRLIFPIIDTRGRIVAFGGRLLDGVGPKYINSPETRLFSKNRNLYGLNFARKTRAGFLLLVEGYLDVLSVTQAGINCAVAPLGTALTRQQAEVMGKIFKKVVIAFDGDPSGRAATERAIDLIEERSIETEVLMLPDGLDPDDFIRAEGGAAFVALIERRLPALDYRLEMARRSNEHDGELDKVAYQEAALQVLLGEKNDILVELKLDQVAENLSLPLTAVRAEWGRRKALLRREEAGRAQSLPPPVRSFGGTSFSRMPVRADDIPPPTDEDDGEREFLSTDEVTDTELLFLAILAQVNIKPSEMEDPVRVEDFSAGQMRMIAAEVLALAEEEQLSQDQLIALSQDVDFAGGKLPELLARVFIVLPEPNELGDWGTDLQRYTWEMRRRQLQILKQGILDRMKTRPADEAAATAIQTQLRECTEKITTVSEQLASLRI